MARTTLTLTCGHTQDFNIYGTPEEQARKAEWLQSRPCLACAKAQAAERTAHLPELKGSVKQVAWANEIRSQAMDWLASLDEDQDFADFVWSHRSAGWWIDYRRDYRRELVNDYSAYTVRCEALS